jgi:hypothetical protein
MKEELIGGNSEQNESPDPFNTDSAEDFFEALENEVNSAVADPVEPETTPQEQSGPEKATHEKAPEDSQQGENWKKRYKDSTREAQKMNSRLKQLEPFVPLLDAMKKDGGLVDHVRDYLKNGGKPSQTIKDQLKLDDDFIFDANEAVQDPNSDSGKLFNAHVNQAVNSKVNKMMDVERKRTAAAADQRKRNAMIADFKARTKMSDEDFNAMMDKANKTPMSLDDIHYLINRDEVKTNVANSTKKDMLKQMKTVRDIPSSNADVNSAQVERSADDDIFDSLKGSDGELENLFGG